LIAGGVTPPARRLPGVLVGAGIAAAGVALLLVLGWLVDSTPFAFDRAIIVGLRHWGGPDWLRAAAINITALGSPTVLTIVVVGAAALLLAERLWLTALATVAACATGGWMVELLKNEVARPRPTLVEHLVQVKNLSFPSGHAAGSATVYLTAAALATQVIERRAARHVALILAILLVGAIGFSRVYLGVHWPSDVAAGWSFGTLWALGWWRATASARASVGGER
jgi:membrane-associated phospholipid phosphatase